MQPYLNQAQQQVQDVYNPAIANIQSQVPAVQQLYGALLSGLQAQSQNQLGNVLQSAAQRGVGSVGLAGSTQAALDQTLAQQQGQLGVQQAQNIAGINTQLGKTQVGQVQATNDLATSLQKQGIENQSNQIQMTDMERKAQLAQQKAQQNYNVQQAQAQAAAAAKASQFDLSKVSSDQITRQLRIGLNGVKGKDGYVSPENLAKAYLTWQAAGLTPDSFWKNFQGLWNPKQGNYGDQFHFFVTGG